MGWSFPREAGTKDALMVAMVSGSVCDMHPGDRMLRNIEEYDTGAPDIGADNVQSQNVKENKCIYENVSPKPKLFSRRGGP